MRSRLTTWKSLFPNGLLLKRIWIPERLVKLFKLKLPLMGNPITQFLSDINSTSISGLYFQLNIVLYCTFLIKYHLYEHTKIYTILLFFTQNTQNVCLNDSMYVMSHFLYIASFVQFFSFITGLIKLSLKSKIFYRSFIRVVGNTHPSLSTSF